MDKHGRWGHPPHIRHPLATPKTTVQPFKLALIQMLVRGGQKEDEAP
jgi:hypothetical protein